MADGLLSQNPNFRRATFLPIGADMSVPPSEREMEFAVPQILMDAYDAFFIPADVISGEYGVPSVDNPAFVDAAGRFSDVVNTSTIGGGLLTPYDADTLYANIGGTTGLTPQRKRRIRREAKKVRDVEVDQLYTPLKNRGDMQGLLVDQEYLGGLEPKKIVGIESFLGRGLLPFYGDRSSTAMQINKIGDMELVNPIVTYGGKDYMRQPNRVWASGDHIVNRLMQATDRAIDQGVDPLGVYIPMKGDAVDFSTMAMDTFISALPFSPISKASMDKVNAELRKIDEDFVGLQSNRIYDYMMNDISGTTRSKMLKRMAKKDLQELGLPEIGQIRRALTDEDLLTVPSGFGGQAIADLRGGLLENELLRDTHPTYPKVGDTVGGYVGGLETAIPQSILFRDIADNLMDEAGNYYLNKSGNRMSDANLKRSIEMKLTPQIVDDRMLEEIDYYNSVLGRF